MDIEKVQLVPKKSQLTPPEGDCKLARINEVEGGETSPTTLPSSNSKTTEEFLFIETPPDALVPSPSPFLSSRPSTAGPSIRSTHVERISTAPSSSLFYKDLSSTSPLHGSTLSEAPGTGAWSPIYHSDNNIPTLVAPSPIIIRTSCQTDENSTEIVHPSTNTATINTNQVPNNNLAVRIKDRGISASLDDLQDANFCMALENAHKINNNGLLNPASLKKPFIFRTISDSTEEGQISDAEIKRLSKHLVPGCYHHKARCHCCCDDEEMPRHRQQKVGSLCGRCSCHDGICACRKHAVSVVNLPSLRKTRRTPGIDEISYDFMRASGALSGKILFYYFLLFDWMLIWPLLTSI